jgi:hypothetical protein
MGLKAGIVGLPNVGKSTIFNALTKSAIPAENYPFCTIDPNIGIVEVPDNRLQSISSIFNPKSIIPSTIEFVDIAGLVKGASQGEGLGNKFLSHIRDVDAIIHVVRTFNENNITHVEGSLNPLRDIETIETELLIKDITSIEKRLVKATKNARTGDKNAIKETEVLNSVLSKMNNNILVHDIDLSADDRLLITPLALLTDKPTLYLVNTDENEIISNKVNDDLKKLSDFANKRGNSTIQLSGKIESEIASLNDDEHDFFLKEYNLNEPGLNKLINASYSLLGLETFFTAGEKEVRAWTIPKNTKAPNAAGQIHSDIERGFIKAEVYSFTELMELKSENALKEAGKIRQEGKNYIVNDGDIIFFKFNV